ncbi:MAG: hypothetical protein ACR2HR_08460 [Euzebya sp.]
MRLAESNVATVIPDWTVGFLRDRCSALQRTLVNPSDPTLATLAAECEVDCICLWNTLLVAAQDLPTSPREALESLQLLHARIAARNERGGVGDISQDVEYLVRAILIDQLQRLTDNAVSLLY